MTNANINHFHLIEGAKNSFLFCDDTIAPKSNRPNWVLNIMKHLAPLKVDGLVIMSQLGGELWKWDFYNADGSSAEMCGNAARCAAVYTNIIEPSIKKFQLATETGVLQIELTDFPEDKISADQSQWVRVKMSGINLKQSDLVSVKTLTVNHQNKVQQIRGYVVNTGVPHFVIEQVPDKSLAQLLRSHIDFGPAGSNITFLNLHEAVTYERGVEDFTLACGTGSLAAALVNWYKKSGKITIGVEKAIIKMPGGTLYIHKDTENIYLEGEARYIGQINLKGKL
jgi:diaminopimelate epimerase